MYMILKLSLILILLSPTKFIDAETGDSISVFPSKFKKITLKKQRLF